MDEVKQLRFKIALGVNSDGAIAYGPAYDLMDAEELATLIGKTRHNIVKGFSVETSTFEKGTHTRSDIKNEFQPFATCLCAQGSENDFLFDGDRFARLPYHIIRESILDVQNDMQTLLSTIMPGNIEDALETAKEIFPQSKKPFIMERNH